MNRIKELRLQHGLTLRKMACELNMHDSALSQYETGKRNPKVEIWQKLADYFGVSVPYLQGRYDHLTKKEALQVIHEVMSVCSISKEELKERL